MRLDQWLRREGLTQKQFAERVQVDQSQVSRMCGENPKWPSRALMRKVVIATRDEVSAADYLFPNGITHKENE